MQLIFPIPAFAEPIQPHETQQIECLARNAYFEARGEGRTGIIAVTHVVLNRINDPRGRFGRTPCAVVHQRSGRSCQFSWVCAGSTIRDSALYRRCRDIVESVYLNRRDDITRGALFYHASSVSGSWFKRNLAMTTRIGGHIFYKG